MTLAPLELYGAALAAGGGLHLRLSSGRPTPLQIGKWLRPADAVDLTVVARCRGPVLDVGCGPGRMVAALARRGVPALGVDVAAPAVHRAASSGALALRRDVFGRLPGEGRWNDVLLMDGNVGIGGDVSALLRRVHALLSPGGHVIVELDVDDHADDMVAACVEDDAGRRSAPFRWARAGRHAVVRRAAALGITPVEAWEVEGRSFLVLAS